MGTVRWRRGSAIARDAIRTIVARHGMGHVRLLGSVARGEEHEHSDIDLLDLAGRANDPATDD